MFNLGDRVLGRVARAWPKIRVIELGLEPIDELEDELELEDDMEVGMDLIKGGIGLEKVFVSWFDIVGP